MQTSGHNVASISPLRGSVIGAMREFVHSHGAFLWLELAPIEHPRDTS